MSRVVQYFKDKAKSIKEYPITLTKAVYNDDGTRLDNQISSIKSDISTITIADHDTIKTYKKCGICYAHFNGYEVSSNSQSAYLPVSSKGIIRLLCFDNNSDSICRIILGTNGILEFYSISGSPLSVVKLYGECSYSL